MKPEGPYPIEQQLVDAWDILDDLSESEASSGGIAVSVFERLKSIDVTWRLEVAKELRSYDEHTHKEIRNLFSEWQRVTGHIDDPMVHVLRGRNQAILDEQEEDA